MYPINMACTLLRLELRVFNTYRLPGVDCDVQDITDGREGREGEHIIIMRKCRVIKPFIMFANIIVKLSKVEHKLTRVYHRRFTWSKSKEATESGSTRRRWQPSWSTSRCDRDTVMSVVKQLP